MNTLFFGTGGIPLSTEPRNLDNGITRINELKLGCMELEFVQSVYVKEDKTAAVKSTATDKDVVLTAHGSYFINLNAKELEKRDKSRERILQAAKILDACGGYSLCFHPAFLVGATREEAHKNVKEQFKKIIQEVKDAGVKLWIRPETAGKTTQYGTIEELVSLAQEFDQVLPCIDYSHLRAFYQGAKFNSYDDYSYPLQLMEKELGSKSLKELHLHVQGIQWGATGEKMHLEIKDDPTWNYKDLMKALKDYKCAGTVICESPNLETDALTLKKTYDSL